MAEEEYADDAPTKLPCKRLSHKRIGLIQGVSVLPIFNYTTNSTNYIFSLLV